MRYLALFVCLAGSLIILPAQTSWTTTLDGMGSFSSPRVADLNADGILDIVLGAGREEFQACDSAVIALDGATGKMLWHVAARDQMFGSAIFADINRDGTPDALISGRSAELIAINGRSGKVIWRYNAGNSKEKRREAGWFNFYNPQWVPDQDGDGQEDILVSNGGDVIAEPYDPNRKPGHLVVLSGQTGKVLARTIMPDGKEIYMSVTACPSADGRDWDILFGTGGETLGGHLYLGKLSQVMAGDLSAAIVLDSSETRGYIGPAARADVTGDGFSDIIVNTVNGRMLAYDGKTLQRLWEVKRPGTETYSSITVGRFTRYTVPDFFASYASGTWPNLEWSSQFMVDGPRGILQFVDSLGFYQNSTGVAADWDGDGYDEILFSVNFQQVNEIFMKFFYNMLVIIDFQGNTIEQIGEAFEGQNLSSTPWIGDLDNDGFFDILYCHGDNLRHTYTFDGFKVRRIATQVPVTRPVRWGAYQGSNYTGNY